MNGRELDRKSAILHSMLGVLAWSFFSLLTGLTAESADVFENSAALPLAPLSFADNTTGFANNTTDLASDGLPKLLGAIPQSPSFSSSDLPSNPSNSGLSLKLDRGILLSNTRSDGLAPEPFPFELRTNGWFQLRHAYFDSQGHSRSRNTISFERLRLGFSGLIYSPDFTYAVTFDGNSDESVEVLLLDGFVDYDIGHSGLGLQDDRLILRGGKWKVPFSRSREESARRFQFSERSTANLFFDIGRSLGLGTLSNIPDLPIPLRIEAALFNGFNTGRDSTIPNEDLDRNFGWSTRLTSDILGEFGDDGEPDLSWHERPALRLGMGVAGSRINSEGPSEFRRQRVVDSGDRLSNLLPASVTQYDVNMYTIDGHWKYRGFSFIAEHHWRTNSRFTGGSVPNLLDHGLLLQSGYFVVPSHLELLCRWASINGDSGTLGVFNQSTGEVAGGFAWYIRGHNTKFNFDVSRITGTPLNSARLNLLPGDDGWLFRTQFQCGF